MWFLIVLNMCACVCWGMEGDDQPPQKKLTVRVPGAMVKAVQARPIPRVPSYDPPTPPPPLPNPVFLNDHVTPLIFNAEDDLNLPELGDPDTAFAEWLDAISVTPLYLVRYDMHRLRYLTFCECSRKKLILKYLVYLVSDPTTAEYTSIRHLSEHMPAECIKREGLLHMLLCRVQQCGHVEAQLSVEELTVKMLVHDMIEHQADSEWYQRIDRRIKESFEEALQALEDESE